MPATRNALRAQCGQLGPSGVPHEPSEGLRATSEALYEPTEMVACELVMVPHEPGGVLYEAIEFLYEPARALYKPCEN